MTARGYTVYYHLNKTNGKVYVGITCLRPKHRWARGKSYKGNRYFANSIAKHGWDGFHHRILIDGLTKEQAELIEENLIRWFNATDRLYGYNIKAGGGARGKHSEESKAKMSIAKRNMTDETKLKMSLAQKGKKRGPRPPEVGAKISAAKTGKKRGPLTKEWKANMSLAHMGHAVSEETKAKWSASRSKKIICVETEEIFTGLREAARAKGINYPSSISSACCGRHETCGGYHWKYMEDKKDERKTIVIS